jgi:hypothetical protein
MNTIAIIAIIVWALCFIIGGILLFRYIFKDIIGITVFFGWWGLGMLDDFIKNTFNK